MMDELLQRMAPGWAAKIIKTEGGFYNLLVTDPQGLVHWQGQERTAALVASRAVSSRRLGQTWGMGLGGTV